MRPAVAADNQQLLTVDHYVSVRSTVPSMAGETAQLYVRERLQAGSVLDSASVTDRVVLFVHGAGTPAEVAFDTPHEDYSWMAYLANAGFDVFAMDVTGYGRSTRPTTMNDPCNLSTEQQKGFVPSLLPKICEASYAQNATTIVSDWNDIGAVVDYIRALRHVERIALAGWSMGGPRAGGYAAQHPERVSRLVLLAPAYNRAAPDGPPAEVPARGAAMSSQSYNEFTENWDRQVGCANQYDAATRESVWSEMMQSDPVGATWGTGVRRAPLATAWGWNRAVVAKMQTPMLMVTGQYDKQVLSARVHDLYADLGAPQKVLIDLACSSHNAMWEKNHLLLYRASLEWLTSGTADGKQQGTLRMGYTDADLK